MTRRVTLPAGSCSRMTFEQAKFAYSLSAIHSGADRAIGALDRLLWFWGLRTKPSLYWPAPIYLIVSVFADVVVFAPLLISRNLMFDHILGRPVGFPMLDGTAAVTVMALMYELPYLVLRRYERENAPPWPMVDKR